MLPNFFVIGAYKSGTTSLYEYLAQHPQVFLPRVKEPNYFAFAAPGEKRETPVFQKSVKTLDEYEALYEKAGGFVAIGDVSPEYMTSHSACRTIRASVPHARLIAILRNPVERAYSDYLMYRRDGKEHLADFSQALEAQAERAARLDPTGFYISTGFYGEQLARYYELFPAAQIKVFLLEELQSDGPRVLSRMFEFLGVDPAFVPGKLTVHNRSGVASSYWIGKLFQYKNFLAPLARRIIPRGLRTNIRRRIEDSLQRPALPPEVRQSLIETYRADLQLLQRLTGRSFSHWLE